ncbi:MAG: hypothetical protein QXQ02_03140 [Halobacteria archaeon]
MSFTGQIISQLNLADNLLVQGDAAFRSWIGYDFSPGGVLQFHSALDIMYDQSSLYDASICIFPYSPASQGRTIKFSIRTEPYYAMVGSDDGNNLAQSADTDGCWFTPFTESLTPAKVSLDLAKYRVSEFHRLLFVQSVLMGVG